MKDLKLTHALTKQLVQFLERYAKARADLYYEESEGTNRHELDDAKNSLATAERKLTAHIRRMDRVLESLTYPQSDTSKRISNATAESPSREGPATTNPPTTTTDER